MSKALLKHIINSKEKGQKLLAILLDPDKLSISNIPNTATKINSNKVDFIFVGGSTVNNGVTDVFVKELRSHTSIPIVLFPGDYTHLTNKADAVLFLSLLSGRNPEYLIEQQIKSVEFLKNSDLEIIPTAYILIDGGVETAVQKVSNTTPIPQNNIDEIVNTAIASEYIGKQLIYLEAGSGATVPLGANIIKGVSTNVRVPIIVGGGIRTKTQLENAFNSGADLIVIGTAFEENNNDLKSIL